MVGFAHKKLVKIARRACGNVGRSVAQDSPECDRECYLHTVRLLAVRVRFFLQVGPKDQDSHGFDFKECIYLRVQEKRKKQ